MMKRIRRDFYLAIILASTFSPNAFSALITVQNHSFESSILSPGGFNTVIPDWTIVSGSAGTFNGTGFFSFIPDGTNTAYADNATITQTLSDVLSANITYQLSVEIGHANNITFGGYTIELWAGSTLLSQDNNSMSDPGSGEWLTASISYSALPGDPLLGQALTIKLISQAQETNFDNVMLDASTAVPVPAAVWLFGSGLLGLAGIARRMNVGSGSTSVS